MSNILIGAIGPDAVAVRRPSAQLAKYLDQLSVPYVVVADEYPSLTTSTVLPDVEAFGRMAADYLLDQQFEHFAVVGHESPRENPRINVFCRAIKRKHKTLDAYLAPLGPAADHPFANCETPQPFVEWLHCLPKPCAIFAHSDQPGVRVIDACFRSGIRVPEEVSVLGVDDDPLFCLTVMPNLASIHVPNRRIGIEAARMILDWQPGRRLIKVAPTAVVERASCRPPRRDDPLVDLALEHLRTETAKGVRVRDLQELTGLSSHQLIYRFRNVTGHTPMEMILRERIASAKLLLATTSEPVVYIARRCGFNTPDRFFVTFRAHTGMSPSEYRNQLAT